MELQEYADWSLKLHERVIAERVPAGGTIEITNRCNLQCVHCYNNLPVQDQETQQRELSFKEHCRLIDEITEAGCLWLLYTGGEIFVRKDFLDIYTYAKQKGLLITLFTNGTRITPEIADHLVEWRPFSIEISLYGRSKEVHEKVTGIPGSFEQCMRGIRLLTERGLSPILKTMAITANIHEIGGMRRFVEGELGLEFRFDSFINPRIDCSRGPLSVRLTPVQAVQLDLQDRKQQTEWTKFCEHFQDPSFESPRGERLYRCGGGTNTFAIDPAGSLGTCVLWHGKKYDLLKGGFQEGWMEFLLHVSRKKAKRHTKCADCGIRDMCGMCPANGELENLDPEDPVDFLCHVAHLRAHALEVSIPNHGDCEYCRGGSMHEDLMRSVAALDGINHRK